MRGSEASYPGALFAQPSTLTTSVRTSLTPSSTDSFLRASNSPEDIVVGIENVLRQVSSQVDGAGVAAAAGGNSSGSTGKGILIGVLSAFGSAAVAVVVLAVFFFFKYTQRGRIILDRIGRPGEYDDEQAFAREEADALDVMDDLSRSEYFRAKGAYSPTCCSYDW